MNNTKTLARTCKLNNGVIMPEVGYGTYLLKEGGEQNVGIKHAIKVGYKLFDLATYYKVHKAMASAMAETNTNRKDLFIVTKIWNPREDFGYAETKQELETIFKELQTDYLDLVLVHWPHANSLAVYRALEEYYDAKKIRAIGVSNFTASQIKDFYAKTRIKPAVNQIQMSPVQPRIETLAACKELGIKVMAWRTVGVRELLTNQTMVKIAAAHKATPAQIALAWALTKNVIIIPKSAHEERILENTQLDNIHLSKQEIAAIDNLPHIPIYWPLDGVMQTPDPGWK